MGKNGLRILLMMMQCVFLLTFSLSFDCEAKTKNKMIYSTSVYGIDLFEDQGDKIIIVSSAEFDLAKKASLGDEIYVEAIIGSSGKKRLELKKSKKFKYSLAYVGQNSYREISYDEFVDYWKDCKADGGLWDNGVSVYTRNGKIVRLGIISS
ncbi:MAG: hypothetical protein IJ679_07085 [Lachnospiraceae bacterium]|nr:hypothetical protein [Lachnospiraceae bacterium]